MEAMLQRVFKVTTLCMDTRSHAVVSAIGQWPHPRRSAAVQPISQQAAAEK